MTLYAVPFVSEFKKQVIQTTWQQKQGANNLSIQTGWVSANENQESSVSVLTKKNFATEKGFMFPWSQE